MESIYCVANASISKSERIAYGAIGVAMAGCAMIAVCWMLNATISSGFAPLLLTVLVICIVLYQLGHHSSALSLTVDAIRYQAVPDEPYDMIPCKTFPLGIFPPYRKIKRDIRNMQSIGTRPEKFIVFSTKREQLEAAAILPENSALGKFLFNFSKDSNGDPVKYPVGVGRMLDINTGSFITIDSKRISRSKNEMLVPAADFINTYKQYSWLVRQTFVIRDMTVNTKLFESKHREHAAAENKQNHGDVIQMADGSTGILTPDQTGVIPISSNTMIPVTSVEDSGMIHSNISDIIDIDDGSKKKSRRHKKQLPSKVNAEEQNKQETEEKPSEEAHKKPEEEQSDASTDSKKD